MGKASKQAPQRGWDSATYLVVCYHDHTIRKVELDTSVCRTGDLPSNRGISANTDSRRAPDLGHCNNQEAKRFFGQGHVGVVEVAVDPVEWRTDELGNIDAEAAEQS